jgi:hypothetical protein
MIEQTSLNTEMCGTGSLTLHLFALIPGFSFVSLKTMILPESYIMFIL